MRLETLRKLIRYIMACRRRDRIKLHEWRKSSWWDLSGLQYGMRVDTALAHEYVGVMRRNLRAI